MPSSRRRRISSGDVPSAPRAPADRRPSRRRAAPARAPRCPRKREDILVARRIEQQGAADHDKDGHAPAHGRIDQVARPPVGKRDVGPGDNVKVPRCAERRPPTPPTTRRVLIQNRLSARSRVTTVAHDLVMLDSANAKPSCAPQTSAAVRKLYFAPRSQRPLWVGVARRAHTCTPGPRTGYRDGAAQTPGAARASLRSAG